MVFKTWDIRQEGIMSPKRWGESEINPVLPYLIAVYHLVVQVGRIQAEPVELTELRK